LATANWGGWDASGFGTEAQKRAVYIAIWLKIEGRDFENQAVGTKAGFLAFGGKPSGGQNQGVFFLENGTGHQAVQSSFKVQFKMQGIPLPNGRVTRNLSQNINRQALMTVGVWHQWEAVLELNTMGQANGIFRMWIDGVQTHDYSDFVYVTPSTPSGFSLYKWNPTWGGQGGRRTRDDYIDVDHVYLSGLPLERRDPN
jgi:hypothetical protein